MAVTIKDPTRAMVNVLLFREDDTTKSMQVVANPSSLSVSCKAAIGKLSPVGWSTQVLQYGHTESASIPIELYFSAQHIWRFKNHNVKSVIEGTNFLMSFVHPVSLGAAAPLMTLVWPSVLSMNLAVEGVRINYTLFDSNLKATIASVNVETLCLETSFVSAGDRQSKGFNLSAAKKGASSMFTSRSPSGGAALQELGRALKFLWGGS